jgi:hypothetical protein
MTGATHQTIKLSKGKHSSPQDGACVMELASMLAGEPFSDHPGCVCPAIGSFLRAYNDSIDDGRRQDLYEYASRVVGTRASVEVQRLRIERLAGWAFEQRPRRWRRLLPAGLRGRAGLTAPTGEAIGTHAVHALRRHNEHSHQEALALLDELIEIGEDAPRPEGMTGVHEDLTAAV